MKRARAPWIAALASAAALAAGAAEPTDPPLCEASVALEPARSRPGQQVRYRLRLFVRSDVDDASWVDRPGFPGLRAERLAARPAARRVLRAGAAYEIRQDERALFADRPGRVAIPPAYLVCRTRSGGISQRIETPEAELLVLAFPETGRPADFRGLTGPLSVRRTVTPESVELGQSVRLTATLQGAGNLWDAAEPDLGSLAPGEAEVFPRPSELELDRGAELVVRRRFVTDLVPRREGVLHIPAFAWRYFDPAAERYAEAVAGPLEVRVGPAAAAAAGGAGRAQSPPDRGSERSAPPGTGRRGAAVAGAAALLSALGAAVWRARQPRREIARRVALALARADEARAAGDRDGELAGLARALRAALGARAGAAEWPVAAPRATPAVGAALEILAAVERARFDPAASAPERAAVLRALAGLRAGARGEAAQ